MKRIEFEQRNNHLNLANKRLQSELASSEETARVLEQRNRDLGRENAELRDETEVKRMQVARLEAIFNSQLRKPLITTDQNDISN